MHLTVSDYLTEHQLQAVRDALPGRSESDLVVQIEECLKYLIIMSERDRGYMPMAQLVDDVWHELILQTPDYEDLCMNRLPGRRFVHHRNITFKQYSSTRSPNEIVDEFLGWIPCYVTRFGPFSAERAKYWIFCDFLMSRLGVSLRQINYVGGAPEYGESR